jgi:hypothetical protein
MEELRSTAVIMKSSVFCNITPYSPLNVNRRKLRVSETSVDFQLTTHRYISNISSL